VISPQISDLPFEEMTEDQIVEALEELPDEQLTALLVDLMTLRDPNSVEEIRRRALRLWWFYGVRDAKIGEVRRTTLGEVRDLVNMPIDDPQAPVWYIVLSGMTEGRGPPVETPWGFGSSVFTGVQIVWEAKQGGRPLGHQFAGRMLIRLEDGSLVPYSTRIPGELPAPTAPPGGPPIPVVPTADLRGPTPIPTPTPTATRTVR